MCGRYYVDENTVKEIKALTGLVEEKLQTGDIVPSGKAGVLIGDGHKFRVETMEWGLPAFSNSKLVINARAETVLDRPLFQEGIRYGRCILPAASFYEWDRDKNKASFWPVKGLVLYMAGFFQKSERKNRFVILTTKANGSVAPVHDRMPLLFNRNELDLWFMEKGWEPLLQKEPELLLKEQEYEQQRLPF